MKKNIKNSFTHYNLISNINRIHTTLLGEIRIKKSLEIDSDVIDFLKDRICDEECMVFIKGKNYYCEVSELIITINSNNFCIITAHK